MTQKPLDESAYSESFWNGSLTPWWVNGVDEAGKRKSEGEHPFILTKLFGKDSSYLDCGAGQGWLTKFISEQGVYCIGIDFSTHAINTSPVKNRMVLSPVTSLPFADNSFDVTISREVFEHLTVDQAEKAFDEMVRVSKKWIYMTIWMNFDPNASDDIVLDDLDKDPTHITFCTRNFWAKKFQKYIDEGILVRREMCEKELDWKNKGRCWVFEKVK